MILFQSRRWNRSATTASLAVLVAMLHCSTQRAGVAALNLNMMAKPYASISSQGIGGNGPSSTADINQQQQGRPQRVAIIGGGVAGLSCAQQLSRTPSEFDVTVFDTGRLRPGGRLSSRLPGDGIKEGQEDPGYQYLNQCILDHAAQIISTTTTETEDADDDENDDDTSNHRMAAFAQQVQQWEQEGVVQEFPPNSLCNIAKPRSETDGAFRFRPLLKAATTTTPASSPQTKYYHGVQGNGNIALALARNANFNLVQDVWVSPSNGARYMEKSQQKWKLQAAGQVLGYFDQLIIAHNGKCADRLMSQTPAKAVHQLLRVNFASSAPSWGGHKMTLNSIYSLSIAVSSNSNTGISHTLPPPFIAGFVQNETNLRFLTCASRKYPSDTLQRDNIEVWTILSSPTFAKQHKAPQEFIPPEKAAEVTHLLVTALEESLGLESGAIDPLESRLQLWGAAVPLNTWQTSRGEGFLYDAEHHVGVCGDWLVESSVAGAWTSGQELAHHLQQPITKPTTVGLEGCFVRSEAAHRGGIASFGESPQAAAAASAAARQRKENGNQKPSRSNNNNRNTNNNNNNRKRRNQNQPNKNRVTSKASQ
uniref:Amine oxidase domain-containing protein n=1 Tax=Entomoneis paludosa TaxID=265537 RepID=A0A7S3DXC2_9STRA|mmetsp:Transcript_8591/g.17855  ORF Transcript_8591/g.17855 Transcript_8591/m.17855 type:complete len:593 (+) Transcript_8591:89-1867(+)